MAQKDALLQKLRALVAEDSVFTDEEYGSGVAFSAQVPMDKVREALAACDEAGYYLESLAALDFQETFELVYHLNCYEPKSRIVVRVLCGHTQSPPSVSDIFPSALWQEREVHDFFGIVFSDSPDMRPLLLPEDADYHPLRKTFGTVHAYRKREEIYG